MIIITIIISYERQSNIIVKNFKVARNDARYEVITNRKSYTSFRLVPKSVTLNDLERHKGHYVLRYFPEFGKPAFQHVTVSICGGIYAQVYCILYCVYDVVVKKVHVRHLIS